MSTISCKLLHGKHAQDGMTYLPGEILEVSETTYKNLQDKLEKVVPIKKMQVAVEVEVKKTTEGDTEVAVNKPVNKPQTAQPVNKPVNKAQAGK